MSRRGEFHLETQEVSEGRHPYNIEPCVDRRMGTATKMLERNVASPLGLTQVDQCEQVGCRAYEKVPTF